MFWSRDHIIGCERHARHFGARAQVFIHKHCDSAPRVHDCTAAAAITPCVYIARGRQEGV